MAGRVAQLVAPVDERVVQRGATALRDGIQPIHQVGQLLGVPALNLHHLPADGAPAGLLLHVEQVGDVVVRVLVDAQPGHGRPRNRHGDDARQVAREGARDEVHVQPRQRRHVVEVAQAAQTVGRRRGAATASGLAGLLLGERRRVHGQRPQTPLDVAQRLQVRLQLLAFGARQAVAQACGVLHQEVQQALAARPVARHLRRVGGRRGRVTEEALVHVGRVALKGDARAVRREADAVVDVLAAELLPGVELQGAEARTTTDVVAQHLVQRGALRQVVPAAGVDLASGEERHRAAFMARQALLVEDLVVQTVQHQELVPVRLERREHGVGEVEREVRLRALGIPELREAAVRGEQGHEAQRRRGALGVGVGGTEQVGQGKRRRRAGQRLEQ